MRLGVIDVGFNTVHLLVVDAAPDARPTPTMDERTTVRLMRYLTDDGAINAEGVAALSEAVARAARVAGRDGVEETLGIVTSAIREATNGPEVLTQLEEVAGFPLRVLSGGRRPG